MRRRNFIYATVGGAMTAALLNRFTTPTEKMPTLFIGHGSPMNAIQKNPFTTYLNQLGVNLPRPKAILVISAHWETQGVRVLKAEKPKTIHDFYGFPKELFDMTYNAPGAPELADNIRARSLLSKNEVAIDESWGLDHGTWSVLTHMYPNADIPVLQLSLNRQFSLGNHLEFAAELRTLRERGVLIVGSGNITHNLRMLDRDPNGKPMDFAVEFDTLIKDALVNRDTPTLLANNSQHHALWKTAHPSIEHFLPLLYTVGAATQNEVLSFPYEGIEHASLSMRAVKIG